MQNSATKQIEEILPYLYVMYYRHGPNPNLTKVFYFRDPKAKTAEENFKGARDRASEHCFKMPQHRLAFVKPFITDLNEEETKFGAPPPPNPLAVVMSEQR